MCCRGLRRALLHPSGFHREWRQQRAEISRASALSAVDEDCARPKSLLLAVDAAKRASSVVKVLMIAASVGAATASTANADHFSYHDDSQCADTPNADTAIAACTRLYESGSLSPRNQAIALGNRGAALKFLGRYDSAIADFTLAIGLDPRNPQYFCQRGDVLRRKQAFNDAVADYTAALARARGSACAYQGRAQAYLAKGKTQQALADVEQALRLKSGGFQLLVLRGRANNQAKLYEAAVADFSQVLASKSQSGLPASDRAALHNERALALLKLDRSADARADVEEALRIAPENATAIATLGLIDEALGRKSEAMASYTRALAIKPDIEVAKRGLERLGPPDATSLPATTPAPEPASETPSSVTLYKIITLASSEHRTSTNEFPTLAQCEAAAKFFHAHAPLRDRSLVYCVKHARSAGPERKS